MTSANDVRELVAGTGPRDWIPFADMGTWTYRDDVDLRIVQHEQLTARFEAPWTHGVQGRCRQYGYVVHYGDSPVEYHVVVSVDDHRASVPEPREPAAPDEPYTITPYQATVGRVITGDGQTFDAYLNRTGVRVQG